MRFLVAMALSVAAIVAVSQVDAKPATAKAAKKVAQASKGQTKATSATIIKELERVRSQLNKADHDYKGHRAAAVHQVTHAIHLLQHGKHHPNPGQHFTGGHHKEPQAKSDAQLRQAIQELDVIARQLQSTNGQHHAKAIAAVHRAVQDLHQALKVA